MLLLISNFKIDAQVRTNYEIINNLIKNSVVNAESLIQGKKTINLSITSSSNLEVLKASILQSYHEAGYKLNAAPAESGINVNYSLISANVSYKDAHPENFLGDIAVERHISINGILTITDQSEILKPVEFAESKIDTVKLDEIGSIENKSLPFTQGQIPVQPLISSFWEPILVVGTLIGTVILLFTVRSK